MAIRLDLAQEEAEDHLKDQIAEQDAKFRAFGRIGDLVRLRDLRVRAGLAQIHGGAASVLQGSFATPPLSDADKDGAVPEVNMAALDLRALRAGLDRDGAVILRNAIPLRRSLDLRKLFDAALSAGRELLDLEDQDLPDIRHTDSKEMFNLVPEKIALPTHAARAFLGDRNMLATFMSPRIAFEWIDILTAQGFRAMVQHLLQDDVRFGFDRCLIRRVHGQDPSPDWAHGAGETGRGLLLWVPLADCGGDTQRPGLDIARPSTTRLAGEASALSRPFIAAGDAVLIRNTKIISKSFGAHFTHDTIAVETCFLGRSRVRLSDLPVFW
ncbi:MAG: hypothetical protein AAF382_17435 [Pseudomonadota bacterium]